MVYRLCMPLPVTADLNFILKSPHYCSVCNTMLLYYILQWRVMLLTKAFQNFYRCGKITANVWQILYIAGKQSILPGDLKEQVKSLPTQGSTFCGQCDQTSCNTWRHFLFHKLLQLYFIYFSKNVQPQFEDVTHISMLYNYVIRGLLIGGGNHKRFSCMVFKTICKDWCWIKSDGSEFHSLIDLGKSNYTMQKA